MLRRLSSRNKVTEDSSQESKPQLVKRQSSKHDWENVDSNANDVEHLITEYQPKISSAGNYHSFLTLVHNSGFSSDEDHEVNTDREDIDQLLLHKMTDQSTDDNYLEGASGKVDSPMSVDALDAEAKKQQEEEWKAELKKTEEEIATLRQVLSSKLRHSAELKRKLGITVVEEFKQDAQHLAHQIQDSTAYKKTGQALKTAGEKASAAASTVGKKLQDVRNSQTFKSFEERASHAYENVKAKVTGSKSEGSFEEALQKDTNSNGNTKVEEAVDASLPENKVPL